MIFCVGGMFFIQKKHSLNFEKLPVISWVEKMFQHLNNWEIVELNDPPVSGISVLSHLSNMFSCINNLKHAVTFDEFMNFYSDLLEIL